MYKSLLVAGLSAGLLTGPAFAGGYGYGDRDYRGDGYDAPEYARVVNTQPVYESVRVDEPRQECWNERVAYRDTRYDANVTAGGLIGAVAGGVIGHQFGGGGGRVLATALGAVVGANVGASTAAANTPYTERSGYQQRCRQVSDTHYEDRVAAYDVTYRYGGRDYTTRMPYDPGDRIAVDVNVQPRSY
ncbi:glycine zipper 2TM domain-containing protein [Solimonas terrae]|uniref:Glycine zipper 2TM domain-containing protein n=1 Tax=Solimonas terrae TaxID=1396819 RepID=A0A6M2BN53_9GAMM|nr:glycine zipper 2TM domain-containing protein [Solimonas terrae]NGY04082.1 glycine zipper 2TM domain-containing protein [Solimonas terrae]